MKTQICVAQMTDHEAAKRLSARLSGKTYMDLIVEVCPFNGSLMVNVGTNRPRTTKKDLTEMVLGLMASELSR